VKCRFDYNRKKVWNPEGQEVISEGLLFLAPDVSIGCRDRILFDGRQWTFVGIRRLRHKTRFSHIEVYLV
jgi:hypothetical protein